MKKIAVVFIIAFVTALVISSCNRESCPAYTQVETNQTGQVG